MNEIKLTLTQEEAQYIKRQLIEAGLYDIAAKFAVQMASAEVWRDVPGHPTYEVSSIGRMRRKGKLLKLIDNGRGYKYVNTYPPERNHSATRSKRLYAHQAVAAAFIGDSSEINHKDGCPANNTVNNLELSDRKHNMDHAAAALKKNIGVKHPGVKLSKESVAAIRKIANMKITKRAIAALYGVSPALITRITSSKYRNRRYA